MTGPAKQNTHCQELREINNVPIFLTNDGAPLVAEAGSCPHPLGTARIVGLACFNATRPQPETA